MCCLLVPAFCRPLSSLHAGLHARRAAIILLTLPLAAGAASGPLAFEEALRLAETRSPQLAAQRSAIAAAEELALAARELPDPKLRLGIDNLPVEGADRFSIARDSMTMRRIGLMQDFPRSEKRELRGRRAEREAERERIRLADARAALRRDVAAAWMERYFAERMAGVISDQHAELRLQRDTMRAGLRAGVARPAELLALDAALQSLLDRHAGFEGQAARATALLSRWLGEDAGRPLAALPHPLPGVEKYDPAAHAPHHPHLRTLAREIDIAQEESALARAAAKPDWSLELAYAQRGPQFSNMVSVQVAIDLPLFQARRQDRSLAASLARLEQARAVREDALRLHLAEARAAWSEWQTATARLARFDDALLPLAQERTALALAAYRGGQAPLAPVLEARRAELELRLQMLQIEADQARAYAQLIYFLPEEDRK
jgi:outer membrane protein TolC